MSFGYGARVCSHFTISSFHSMPGSIDSIEREWIVIKEDTATRQTSTSVRRLLSQSTAEHGQFTRLSRISICKTRTDVPDATRVTIVDRSETPRGRYRARTSIERRENEESIVVTAPARSSRVIFPASSRIARFVSRP